MITQEPSNKVVYFATTSINIQYWIIVLMLVYFVEIAWEQLGFYIFVVTSIFSTVTMFIISKNALDNDTDRSKTITKLAIYHVPCLIGLTCFFYWGFIIL